ncbi:uncharacterized protein TNCV_2307741 [Trichonephila clavipes]|nr:uncharacterized protein TNCV_2307741 [Trichonephila clavipes]
MAQRKHLDDFLRGRIIGRLGCGRTSWKYPKNLESPRVSSPAFDNDSKMMCPSSPCKPNIVDECIQSEDISRMDWPAYSPDLNPIEHVWDMLGRRIAVHQSAPTCLPELRRAVLDEWCNIHDEAHFWLNGYVNKQNCRIWSEANPQVYVETPLHPEKLTVWCALWAGGILLQKR